MEQIVLGVMAVLMGLVVLIIGAGWIVPLILGIIGRRRQWPSAGVWRILAMIWGGVALLLALGVSGIVFMASRITSAHESKAPLFDGKAYRGETAILRLAYTGGAECVIRNQAGKMFRCASSNGSMAVPTGILAIRECKVMATDAQSRQWTATARFWDETNITVGANEVQAIGFGPPFLTAVNMDWAPVSSKISLAPLCADRAGHSYTIQCSPQGAPPTFQVLDAKNQVAWSGKFEFG